MAGRRRRVLVLSFLVEAGVPLLPHGHIEKVLLGGDLELARHRLAAGCAGQRSGRVDRISLP